MSMYYTVITGASKGIGRCLAEEYAKQKCNLVLISRDAKELQYLSEKLMIEYAISVKYLAIDLSLPNSIALIHTFIKKNKLIVDVLVNNAGFGSNGSVIKTDLSILVDMITTNCTSLVQLSHILLNHSLLKTKGHIINIASTAAFQSGPYMAIYYASKAFVLSFSEALAIELKPFDVKVTTICPGPVKTNFHVRSGTEKALLSKGTFIKIHTPEFIAQRIVRITNTNKILYIPGIINKIMVCVSQRLSPRYVTLKITEKLNKPKTTVE